MLLYFSNRHIDSIVRKCRQFYNRKQCVPGVVFQQQSEVLTHRSLNINVPLGISF